MANFNKFGKFTLWLCSLLTVLFMYGCEDMEKRDRKYNFIGDSIINHWPVADSFPSQVVYNYGLSGAGIDYLLDYKDAFIGENVVVMIGTNDNNRFYSGKIDEYVDNYLSIISSLTDQTIYLYSVLPRKFATDSEDINERISEFNQKVKDASPSYPNIVYLDVFDDFLDGDHINYQYYSDGLHLTLYGYELLTSKLLDYIQ